jgi:hypothetical protein
MQPDPLSVELRYPAIDAFDFCQISDRAQLLAVALNPFIDVYA